MNRHVANAFPPGKRWVLYVIMAMMTAVVVVTVFPFGTLLRYYRESTAIGQYVQSENHRVSPLVVKQRAYYRFKTSTGLERLGSSLHRLDWKPPADGRLEVRYIPGGEERLADEVSFVDVIVGGVISLLWIGVVCFTAWRWPRA